MFPLREDKLRTDCRAVSRKEGNLKCKEIEAVGTSIPASRPGVRKDRNVSTLSGRLAQPFMSTSKAFVFPLLS